MAMRELTDCEAFDVEGGGADCPSCGAVVARLGDVLCDACRDYAEGEPDDERDKAERQHVRDCAQLRRMGWL